MSHTIKSVEREFKDVIIDSIITSVNSSDTNEANESALLDLPVEIILKICTFLNANFLKYTFAKVCRRFADILADDHLWKYRIHNKIRGCFPVIPQLNMWDNIDWQKICVDIDTEEIKWKNVKKTTKHIVVKDVHFASVDTVLLVNNGEICISGGRDRSMALWNVLDIKPHDKSDNSTTLLDTKPKQILHDAHAGWVWDLTSDSVNNASMIFSASWDNTVKAWDMNSHFTCVETFKCGMSALSVVYGDNIVTTGLYSKKILSFDIREGAEPINIYKPHKGPVLGLATHNNLIASVSEDKTVAVWDRTAGKLLMNEVKLPIEEGYPVSINWSPSAMYIGDSKGCLHLVHPEEYKYMKTHEIWPEPPAILPRSKIIGCWQSQGNMIVCSDRGEIKFFYHSYPPQEYARLESSTYDITQLKYLNGILVIGTCDSALEFWIPTEKYQDL